MQEIVQNLIERFNRTVLIIIIIRGHRSLFIMYATFSVSVRQRKSAKHMYYMASKKRIPLTLSRGQTPVLMRENTSWFPAWGMYILFFFRVRIARVLQRQDQGSDRPWYHVVVIMSSSSWSILCLRH